MPPKPVEIRVTRSSSRGRSCAPAADASGSDAGVAATDKDKTSKSKSRDHSKKSNKKKGGAGASAAKASSSESDSEESSEGRALVDENSTLRAELASMGARLTASLALNAAGSGGSAAGGGGGVYVPPAHFSRSRAARDAAAAAALLGGAPSAADAAMIATLPQQLKSVLKWCASAHNVVFTGLAADAVVFKSRFGAVCKSFDLSHVLLHPSSRRSVVPEQVRLAQNEMMWLLLQAAFVRFPERLPVDPTPELSQVDFPPVPRAWWVWSHLSDTRAVLSAQEGHSTAARFMGLRQGNGIHSLAKFFADIQECRRILAVAPDSLVITPHMLTLQLKNGLNTRCRLYLNHVDLTSGDIEDWMYALTILDNEWLQENRHGLPGTVTSTSGSISSAAGGASYDAPGSGAAGCSFCDDKSHCVDKCGKRMKVLAKGQAELKAARETNAQARRDAAKAGAGAGAKGGPKPTPVKVPKEKKVGEKKTGDQPCYDFQKGTCTRVVCKYKHVKAPPPSGNSSAAAASAAAPAAAAAASPATILAVARFIRSADGNRELQKAIRDSVDEGWVNALTDARPVSQYSQYDPTDRVGVGK